MACSNPTACSEPTVVVGPTLVAPTPTASGGLPSYACVWSGSSFPSSLLPRGFWVCVFCLASLAASELFGSCLHASLVVFRSEKGGGVSSVEYSWIAPQRRGGDLSAVQRFLSRWRPDACQVLPPSFSTPCFILSPRSFPLYPPSFLPSLPLLVPSLSTRPRSFPLYLSTASCKVLVPSLSTRSWCIPARPEFPLPFLLHFRAPPPPSHSSWSDSSCRELAPVPIDCRGLHPGGGWVGGCTMFVQGIASQRCEAW